MTLVPLVIGVCLNFQDAKYTSACDAALTQSVQGSAVDRTFDEKTRVYEEKYKDIIVNEKVTTVVASLIGFTYNFARNQESIISVKLKSELTGQFKFSTQTIGLGVRYDF